MKTSKYDFTSVDWLMRGVDIARGLGCSHAQVSRMRAKLAPGSLQRGRLACFEEVDWSRTCCEIAVGVGLSAPTVAKYARLLVPGIELKRGKKLGHKAPKWDEDWARSNREIAESRGVTRQAVNLRRKREAGGRRWERPTGGTMA